MSFRYRILKEAEYRSAHPSTEEAFQQKRQRDLAAMPKAPTVSDWLPFYENVWEVPTYSKDILGPEVAAVNAHPEELVALLASEDMTVARRAAFATTFLRSVPPYLVEPLARTGRQTTTLIRAARAGGLPNDPDEVAEERASSFFTQWSMAMDHAGGSASRRGILEEIAAELEGGARDEKLEGLAGSVKTALETGGK
jgi:hypothetical protein